ncbi:type II secretion system minor pseudopilin GspK [Marinomonas sp. 2405UD68-3]|uniref:type II secretion system minor pseudopilin GspK n=1 Tax=Marinomonas sp. 2405UD68-3 TaxID=3391835 RepID=UPI0039C93809
MIHRLQLQKAKPTTQRGVALIMALMVFALVSAMAASVMTYLAKERDIIEQVQQTSQLKQQLLGGEAWAIQYFAQLDEKSLPAFESSKWLLKQETFPLEQEKDEMTIVLLDRQSCFNINLLANETTAELSYQRLQRLITSLGKNPNLADQIKDWVDSDQDITGAGGHEDEFYQSFSPSFRASDSALVSETEMLLWRWTPEDLAALLPWLCIWPVEMGANVNRFPKPLQDAYLVNMTEEQKKKFTARLDSAGFATVKEFLQEESLSDQGLEEADWRTNMAYVDAFIKVTLGDRQMSLHTRLIKSNSGNVRVYGRSYGSTGWLVSFFNLPSIETNGQEE